MVGSSGKTKMVKHWMLYIESNWNRFVILYGNVCYEQDVGLFLI
jgi:hypothetical protein